jgi:thiamine kinase-like enzyme
MNNKHTREDLIRKILGKDILIEDICRIKRHSPIHYTLPGKADVLRVKYNKPNQKKEDVIVKILSQKLSSKNLPNKDTPFQVKHIATGTVNSENISYEVLDFIPGRAFSKTLKEVHLSGELSNNVVKQTLKISDYLADIYNQSSKSDKVVYVRETCNFITYTKKQINFLRSHESYNKYNKSVKIIDNSLDKLLKDSINREKVCLVHNDFHPNNIIFNGSDLHTIDKIGRLYGDQLVDISAVTLFYIWNELRSDIESRPFLKLHNLFMDNYVNKTKNNMFGSLPIFYGSKSVMLIYNSELMKLNTQLNKPLLNIVCKSINEDISIYDSTINLINNKV